MNCGLARKTILECTLPPPPERPLRVYQRRIRFRGSCCSLQGAVDLPAFIAIVEIEFATSTDLICAAALAVVFRRIARIPVGCR